MDNLTLLQGVMVYVTAAIGLTLLSREARTWAIFAVDNWEKRHKKVSPNVPSYDDHDAIAAYLNSDDDYFPGRPDRDNGPII